MALTQAQIDEQNKIYAKGTSSKGIVATKDQISTNNKKLLEDAIYRQSEVDRTNTVINERTSQGLDTTAQNKYLGTVNSYNTTPTTPAPPPIQQVPVQQVPQQPSVQSNITEMYNSLGQTQVQALKQRIAEAKASQQAMINQAPQQYNPLRAQSEVAKSQQLRSVLEQSANAGDRGGVGRQQALLTQTEGANRLNSIDMQQQNFVDSANAEISRLQSEGNYQEAEILANVKSQELQAAIAQSNQDRQFGLQEAGLTGTYNGNQTLAGQQLGLQREGQLFDQNMATDTFGLNKQGQEFSQGLATDTFNLNKEGQTFNQGIQTQQMGLQQAQFDQGVKEFEAQFGLNLRQQSFSEAQAAIQNSISRGNLSVSRGNLALSNAKFIADNDPNSLDNRVRAEQLKQLKNEGNKSTVVSTPTDLKPFQDYIRTNLYTVDTQGNKRTDLAAVGDYLGKLSETGVSDAALTKLAQNYGLQATQVNPNLSGYYNFLGK